MKNDELIYHILTFIPRGQVLIYKNLADICGVKNPRAVGTILHKNPDPKLYPCHRVVNSKGQLAKNYAFGGIEKQKEKLILEGVYFVGDKVDLSKSLWQPTILLKIYFKLLKQFGSPGPWPWFGQGSEVEYASEAKIGFSKAKIHRSDDVYQRKISGGDMVNLQSEKSICSQNDIRRPTQIPHTPQEIAIGAILTQNTNWRNVEKSLNNLRAQKCASLASIEKLELGKLKILINPSGFFNQKANYLKEFSSHVCSKYGSIDKMFDKNTFDLRQELLSLKGIGPETADTILLYAGNQPVFVIDAYTKRFAKQFNLDVQFDYDVLQKYFMQHLPKNITLYQDFHALIVQWAKTTKLDLSR